MRKALDALYGVSLIGACLSMVLIAALVSVQVLGRVVDRAAVLFGGARYGFAIPSLAEIGGFLFVASAFLALPAALRSAGHVRVTLALRLFGDRGDRVMSILVLVVGLCLAAFAAWAIGVQTFASFQRGSVSYGLVAISLWIPQAVMTLGLTIFVIALLDELVTALSGQEPAFRRIEKERETGEGAH
ncbi:TRAP-type C4-dicarboxylate transport system, small permease component [Aureimonas altamirensis DSM 21988]|uniref:TRAP transporter small permease protein n=2 Tax=Aureimonas altamirensis TaxID=370622 RepID=A0A0P0YXI0_9HYPH|nr:TRAP transporter small permease [Aureimonas altamirensis]BAT26204.1 putative membrane protein [Aureimonas altamirensis]SHJ40718.1 TRAP-type C4-dicarboxylate transport system, small permease component [Aureimonas altamirensis DSM 21988]